MAVLYLTDQEKKCLLKIARETLTHYLTVAVKLTYPITSGGLVVERPAFVTLWDRNHHLRGCVGRIKVSAPLYKTVQDCAVNAATQDPRFDAVNVTELENLLIEVSVLSPFEKITSPQQIEIGRHGLLIRQTKPHEQVGLLLPQVASERNWSQTQFLDAICHKAKLPVNAWQAADLYIFETEVFEEEHPDVSNHT